MGRSSREWRRWPNVNSWTKAGVMIRGGLAANAQFAFMIVSAGKGTVLPVPHRHRRVRGEHDGTWRRTAPTWVKLVRQGIDASRRIESTNGTSWTTVGSASLSLGQIGPDRSGGVEPRQLPAGRGVVRQRQPVGGQ